MTPFYSFWKSWFAAPEPAKMERSKASGRGGYYPIGSESPGYSGRPDPKEYYHWRLKDFDANFGAGFGGQETLDAFWDCYSSACDWLQDHGLQGVLDATSPDDCVLRILHYLPTPDGLAGEAHRDFDLLTVNVGGTCPGLEVRKGELEDRGGSGVSEIWEQSEGGIHVGGMLQIYTENEHREDRALHSSYIQRATPHRVRLPPDVERYAAVFFYLPPMDFVLRPGLTAHDYLFAPPGTRADGHTGVLVRAGTAAASAVRR